VLNPRHTSAQELLYQRWSDEATAIEITFDDGSTLVGQLKDYDTYALHVQDSAGVPVLIFKQAVRSIRPQATDSVDTAPHSR
jgi:sRNA-binding regulator protein Hfq